MLGVIGRSFGSFLCASELSGPQKLCSELVPLLHLSQIRLKDM